MGLEQEERGFDPDEVPDQIVEEVVRSRCTRIECGDCGEYFWEVMRFGHNVYTECDHCGGSYILGG